MTILRPGTLEVALAARASGLQAGKTYELRIAAVDFDGRETVGFAPFVRGVWHRSRWSYTPRAAKARS